MAQTRARRRYRGPQCASSERHDPEVNRRTESADPGRIAKGAEAYGFRGDVWTASRVAQVIEQTFGVRYHRDHVGRLLREAGWSRQQPVERASQRNEEAIEQWSEQRWPDH